MQMELFDCTRVYDTIAPARTFYWVYIQQEEHTRNIKPGKTTGTLQATEVRRGKLQTGNPRCITTLMAVPLFTATQQDRTERSVLRLTRSCETSACNEWRTEAAIPIAAKILQAHSYRALCRQYEVLENYMRSVENASELTAQVITKALTAVAAAERLAIFYQGWARYYDEDVTPLSLEQRKKLAPYESLFLVKSSLPKV